MKKTFQEDPKKVSLLIDHLNHGKCTKVKDLGCRCLWGLCGWKDDSLAKAMIDFAILDALRLLLRPTASSNLKEVSAGCLRSLASFKL